MQVIIDDYTIIVKAEEHETEDDVVSLQNDLNMDMVMCLTEELRENLIREIERR